MKEERFEEAGTYWATLKEVRAALQRIEDRTYGRCLVDGEPIDEKRLEATPLGGVLPAAPGRDGAAHGP